MRIPTDAIDETALPRDRTGLSGPAFTELKLSIAKSGLRLPIEVFATRTGYALISGYRRLLAVRALHQSTGDARFAEIEATLRTPATRAEALTAMVEENEIREALSPWERGAIIVRARDLGIFETLDAATAALYPNVSRQKRSRLRAIAGLVEDLGDVLPFPEALSQNQCTRLATAARHGLLDLLRTALEETNIDGPESQWTVIAPAVAEAMREMREKPDPTPGRPRRVLRPRHGLTIRREVSRNGYVLRFTGKEAKGELVDLVMDEVERMLGG